MSFNGNTVEQEEYRVVLVLPWSGMVLVEHHGYTYRLPRITIPKWTRVVEQLIKAIQVKWAVRSTVIDFLPKSSELPVCVVIEVRSRDWGFALAGLTPIQVSALNERELTMVEGLTVNSIIAGEKHERGPFSKVGWIEDAQEWIWQSVSDHRVEFNEDVRGTNAGGTFALVRFGTLHGPAYWLKATGAPNTHEFGVTATIARYFPKYVPPFVTGRTDWNAWVTEEAGYPLHEASDIVALEQSVNCLGGLQTASIPHINELLAIGCFDQRMPILRARLPNLIRYLAEIMVRQTSTKVPPISSVQLHRLGQVLDAACGKMESLNIPDTLVHNDMNLSNILCDGKQAFLTDWAEGCVGNPFFTLQHLLAQASRLEAPTSAVQLTKIYATYWRGYLSDGTIRRAALLAPPLAIASYLIGRGTMPSVDRGDSCVQGYSRSLARHMARAAQTPEFLETLCH